MNYEKAYKEAPERAKSKIENDKGHVLYEDDIVAIFPELAESEGERISREITEFLGDFNNGEYEIPNENTIDSWLSWLEKQGKDKPSWSEEDEKIIETMCKEGDLKPSEMRWLKSLKDRVQSQLKQEWSEKDENILKRIDNLLYSLCQIHGSEYEELHNWLKSLKPNH